MQALLDQLTELDKQLSIKETQRVDRKAHLTLLEEEVAKLETESDLLGRVDQALLAVSIKILARSTKNIDRLVTMGLRATFDDLKFDFVATSQNFRGKTSISFDLLQDGRSVPLREGYGGGVLVVIGVLLRIVVVMALGLKRVIILDESLSHLAAKYRPNASKLLRKLCEELGFTIVMVSHDPEYAEEANFHYEAFKEKNGSTGFRMLKGKVPQKSEVVKPQLEPDRSGTESVQG